MPRTVSTIATVAWVQRDLHDAQSGTSSVPRFCRIAIAIAPKSRLTTKRTYVHCGTHWNFLRLRARFAREPHLRHTSGRGAPLIATRFVPTTWYAGTPHPGGGAPY